MFGKSVGKLNIYTRNAIGGGYRSVWSRAGSLGEYWERTDAFVSVSVSVTGQQPQMIIESEAANNTIDDGIIAVDDISFTSTCIPFNGQIPDITTTTAKPPCGVDGFRCSDGKCINKTQVCDFNVDCRSGEDESSCGTCNFETDYCGWYDNSFGGHIWNRTTASLAGIPKDATSGTQSGSLVSYETSEGAFSGLSRLFTPYLGKSGSSCEFEFYYYKTDPSTKASVSLSLFLIDATNKIERIWRTDEISTNDNWIRKAVGVYSRDPGFRLYFEASQLEQALPSKKQLLAVDETKFINCPIVFNTSCESKNVFKCANGFCIPDNLVRLILKCFLFRLLIINLTTTTTKFIPTKVCDFSNDCSDGSDEVKCGNYTRCDFEDDSDPICSWNSDNDADLKWQRAQGQDYAETFYNLPSFGYLKNKYSKKRRNY
jgi:hypothetical protein